MLIRPAKPAEAAVCSDVVCSSIRELCHPDHEGSEEVISAWLANKTPKHFAPWITNAKERFLVAVRSDEIAGVAVASRDAEIVMLFVSPTHRFKGVSTSLLAELETRIGLAGFLEARLSSTKTAHEFYRSKRWKDAGDPSPAWGRIVGYPMTKNMSSQVPNGGEGDVLRTPVR